MLHSSYIRSTFQVFQLYLFEFLDARTVFGSHSASILTAFVQHSSYLPTGLQALFGQQSNCSRMAFEVHSEYYDSILNIPTVFQTTFELHSRANTLGMYKNHSMRVRSEFLVFERHSSENLSKMTMSYPPECGSNFKNCSFRLVPFHSFSVWRCIKTAGVTTISVIVVERLTQTYRLRFSFTLCVFLRFHCIRLLKLYACKGFRKCSYIWAWFALFSILLFHPTVFFHFTEQINDDDDDDDDDIDWYFKCYAKNLERLFLLKHGVYTYVRLITLVYWDTWRSCWPRLLHRYAARALCSVALRIMTRWPFPFHWQYLAAEPQSMFFATSV